MRMPSVKTDTRRATLRDGVALLLALQGCMKPVKSYARRRGGAHRSPQLLAGRDEEVKALVGERLTMTVIAERLEVSRKTLRNYIEEKGLRG